MSEAKVDSIEILGEQCTNNELLIDNDDIIDVSGYDFEANDRWLYLPTHSSSEYAVQDLYTWLKSEPEIRTQDSEGSRKSVDTRTFTRPKKRSGRLSFDSIMEVLSPPATNVWMPQASAVTELQQQSQIPKTGPIPNNRRDFIPAMLKPTTNIIPNFLCNENLRISGHESMESFLNMSKSNGIDSFINLTDSDLIDPLMNESQPSMLYSSMLSCKDSTMQISSDDVTFNIDTSKNFSMLLDRSGEESESNSLNIINETVLRGDITLLGSKYSSGGGNETLNIESTCPKIDLNETYDMEDINDQYLTPQDTEKLLDTTMRIGLSNKTISEKIVLENDTRRQSGNTTYQFPEDEARRKDSFVIEKNLKHTINPNVTVTVNTPPNLDNTVDIAALQDHESALDSTFNVFSTTFNQSTPKTENALNSTHKSNNSLNQTQQIFDNVMNSTFKAPSSLRKELLVEVQKSKGWKSDLTYNHVPDEKNSQQETNANFDNTYDHKQQKTKGNFDATYDHTQHEIKQSFDATYDHKQQGIKENFDETYDHKRHEIKENLDATYNHKAEEAKGSLDATYNHELGEAKENLDATYNHKQEEAKENFDATYNYKQGETKENFDATYNHKHEEAKENFDATYQHKCQETKENINITYEHKRQNIVNIPVTNRYNTYRKDSSRNQIQAQINKEVRNVDDCDDRDSGIRKFNTFTKKSKETNIIKRSDTAPAVQIENKDATFCRPPSRLQKRGLNPPKVLSKLPQFLQKSNPNLVSNTLKSVNVAGHTNIVRNYGGPAKLHSMQKVKSGSEQRLLDIHTNLSEYCTPIAGGSMESIASTQSAHSAPDLDERLSVCSDSSHSSMRTMNMDQLNEIVRIQEESLNQESTPIIDQKAMQRTWVEHKDSLPSPILKNDVERQKIDGNSPVNDSVKTSSPLLSSDSSSQSINDVGKVGEAIGRLHSEDVGNKKLEVANKPANRGEIKTKLRQPTNYNTGTRPSSGIPVSGIPRPASRIPAPKFTRQNVKATQGDQKKAFL